MAEVIDGRLDVAASITPEKLASSQQVEWVIVQALSDNTQAVEIGASTVVEGVATQRGLRLTASQVSPPLPVDDLADIWVDVQVNGEGVSFVAVTGP